MPEAINRSLRNEFVLGAALVVAGLLISGAALSVLREQGTQLAQAPSTQSTPSTNVDQKNSKDGAGSKDLAPEPARPSESTTGSSPASPGEKPAQKQDALPAAPAEKMGAPVAPK